MDTVLAKIQRLAAMASQEAANPVPLDSALVMAKVRGLTWESDDASEALPVFFFAGGALAAAAVALFVVLAAFPDWTELESPLHAFSSLPEMVDTLL